ncbi:unnamed protein product [Chrysoparadoxa australica]
MRYLSSDLSEAAALSGLDCSHNKLVTFPAEMEALSSMTCLRASHNRIQGFPGNFYLMGALETLDLSHNKLESLPTEEGNLELLKITREWTVGVGLLKELMDLDVSHNLLTGFPSQLEQCAKLKHLNLSHNSINTIGEFIDKNSELESLDISHNRLRHLPPQLAALTRLSTLNLAHNTLVKVHLTHDDCQFVEALKLLDLSDNDLTKPPQIIGHLPFLEVLRLGRNPIASVQLPWSKLRRLRELRINHTGMRDLDDNAFTYLSKLVTLDISGLELVKLPKSLSSCFKLKTLLLGENKLSSDIVAALGTLISLTELQLNGNELTELPAELLRLANLTMLDLSHNQIKVFPEEISKLAKLTTLLVNNNSIAVIPLSLGSITSLTHLNLSANQISSLPDELCTLVSVYKLDLSHNMCQRPPLVIRKWPKLVHCIMSGNPMAGTIGAGSHIWQELLRLTIQGDAAVENEEFHAAVKLHGQAAKTYSGMLSRTCKEYQEVVPKCWELHPEYHFSSGAANLFLAEEEEVHVGRSQQAMLEIEVGTEDRKEREREYMGRKKAMLSHLSDSVAAFGECQKLRVLSRLPNQQGDVYLNRAKALMKLGRHAEAIHDLDRCKALSKFTPARLMRGRARNELGQYERARLEVSKMVKDAERDEVEAAEVHAREEERRGMKLEEALKQRELEEIKARERATAEARLKILAGEAWAEAEAKGKAKSKEEGPGTGSDSESGSGSSSGEDDNVGFEGNGREEADKPIEVVQVEAAADATVDKDASGGNDQVVDGGQNKQAEGDRVMIGREGGNAGAATATPDEEPKSEESGVRGKKEAIGNEPEMRATIDGSNLERARTQRQDIQNLMEEIDDGIHFLHQGIDMSDLRRGYEITGNGGAIRSRGAMRSLLSEGESELRFQCMALKDWQRKKKRSKEKNKEACIRAYEAATKARLKVQRLRERHQKALEDYKLSEMNHQSLEAAAREQGEWEAKLAAEWECEQQEIAMMQAEDEASAALLVASLEDAAAKREEEEDDEELEALLGARKGRARKGRGQ